MRYTCGNHSGNTFDAYAPMSQVVQLYDGQMPEGLDEVLWLRFVELHDARARLDLVVRDQTAQVRS